MSKLDQLLKVADLLADDKTTSGEFPFEGAVAIRTVTHYYTGRVVGVRDGLVLLADAAWIADTGRWADFLTSGKANEVGPFPGQVGVSLGAIVDVTPFA